MESNKEMEDFSFGLTLDSVNVFTCNNEWEPKFMEEDQETLYKKMNI